MDSPLVLQESHGASPSSIASGASVDPAPAAFPVGSWPWFREAALGCWLALLFLQCASIIGLLLARYGIWTHPGVAAWISLHRGTGPILMGSSIVLALAHPQPRTHRPDGRSSSCPKVAITRRLGLASGLAGLALLMSGAVLLKLSPLWDDVSRFARAAHTTAAVAMVVVLPIHLAAAIRGRNDRWRRRQDSGDHRVSRYRGGWWPACAAAAVCLAVGLVFWGF